MKKSILLQTQSTLFLLATLLLFQSALAQTDELQQIRRAIAQRGAKWTASETWLMKLSPEERTKLCGSISKPPHLAQPKLLSIPHVENLPWKFDWRDNNGNWVTPPKNQFSPKWCGSCWDFAAVAQTESWWKIHHANSDSMIDLSEQFILSCGNAGTCNGGWPELVLEFIKTVGVPSEKCFPYRADDKIPCNNACSNWADEAAKIPGWGYITWDEVIIDNLKSAVYRHPVAAFMMVYEDFMSYSGGVYEYVWGGVVYGHDILIVGWNDAEQCWIGKNSFGTNWGESANLTPYTPGAGDGGYFRIKYGECEFGMYAVAIWDEIVSGPAFAISPDRIDTALTIGDTLSQPVTLSNIGLGMLEFSSMDYDWPVVAHFRSGNFQAYNGFSWWCGDPQIAGYGNNWLQYLDLPALDLSSASNPKLSFMGYWATEDPSNVWPPVDEWFDGWDGCNIWLSTDGAKSFEVAVPNSPAYNCSSLFSFGGIGIAGWAGKSNGWKPVELDLSPYKGEGVIIRFAFASDAAFCTKDDPTLYGFLIDDIMVADGSEVLFENHGDADTTMHPHGYAGSGKADWLTLSPGAGTIAPNTSLLSDLRIDTRGLSAGRYVGQVFFTSNDSTYVPFYSNTAGIQIDLELRAPDYDVAVERVSLPCDSIPLFIPIKPGAQIRNCGLYDGADFEVTCTILRDGQSFYNDTAHVSLLLADQSSFVEFKPFTASQQADLDFVITVNGFPNDYNAYNNRIRSTVGVTNLVDDFGTETGFWTFEGGWGITKKFGGHSGNSTVHVNNGTTPYQNNMDAKLTFVPGFHFQLGDTATLKYWTVYGTEPDKDVCYVEVTGDSLNWIKMDSVSGTGQKWTERQVSLLDFIEAGYSKVWIRFHFISDGENTGVGVLIDDVAVYPEPTGTTFVQDLPRAIPAEYGLEQNFPNPFNPSTTIKFALPKSAFVTLKVYNLLGEEIAMLLSEKREAGIHQFNWDARGLASGVYLYRLEAGEYVQAKKLILMR